MLTCQGHRDLASRRGAPSPAPQGASAPPPLSLEEDGQGEVDFFLDAFADELSASQWAGVAAKLKAEGGLSADRGCALPLVCDGCTRIIELAPPTGSRAAPSAEQLAARATSGAA